MTQQKHNDTDFLNYRRCTKCTEIIEIFILSYIQIHMYTILKLRAN